MNLNSKYPILARILGKPVDITEVLSNGKPLPKEGALLACIVYWKTENGNKIYKSLKKPLQYYVWDSTHGEWEVYTRKGINFAAMDIDGNIKPNKRYGPKGSGRQRLKV